MACRESVVRRPMARPAWVIPRAVFDARLVAEAVDAGAVLRRHRVRSLERLDDRVVVDERLSARVVVGADGAHSVRPTLRSDTGNPVVGPWPCVAMRPRPTLVRDSR